MIFGNDYDNSLWYMLNVDNDNRKEIIDFLRELPPELVFKIRTAIKALNNGEYNKSKENTIYDCIDSKADPQIDYDFSLDIIDHTLLISKNKKEIGDKDYEVLFDLELSPMSLDDAKDILYNQGKFIGSVTNSKKEVYSYALRNITIGYVAVRFRVYERSHDKTPLFTPVEPDKVPQNYTILNLKNMFNKSTN